VAVLPTVIHDAVTPPESLALDRMLLARAAAERRPWLRICTWPGDLLLLGRFHPALLAAGVHRRLSGGRAVPAGDGFVQVSLALPHRSALESDDPHALRAEQVMNRAVRGIMGGMELLGLEAYYPGRDMITVGGKAIAWLSLAVEAGGGTLVEAGVSLTRGLDVLPALADRCDPDGAVPVTMWAADDVTTLASALGGRTPAPREVALAIAEGYRRRLQLEPVMEQLPVLADQQSSIEPDAPPRPRSQRRVMLGALLASACVDAGGKLEAVWLGGDLIAPAATVRSIMDALTGQPPAADTLRATVERILERPDDFLLGANATDVAAVVAAAAAR
jgi:hypothetical protein